ncbi:MAG: patatin-like phospholipase family protein [Bacillota bacterium]
MDFQAFLDLIGPHAAARQVEAGARIVEQGAQVDEVSFIADGGVDLMLPGIPPVILDHRGPGEAVGAEWVVTGEPAGCSVVAAQGTRLLSVSKETLYKLLAESGDFARHFLEITMVGKMAVQQAAGRMHVRANQLEAHIASQVDDRYGDLLGSSRAMKALREQVRIQADLADPLLLVGEPGVGKELVAANIHLMGARKTEAFVMLHAAEWTADLWREKVEIAAGGTILVREIADLPAEGLAAVGALCVRAASDQPRLIATLTERSGQTPRRVPPWGSVPSLRVLPLREHKTDIPELARAFLRELNAVYGATDQAISSEAMRLLMAYPYLAANVAELRSIITHAAHVAGGDQIRPEHLRLGVHGPRAGRPMVGLALGGGVVRGMAHIGVLQVLTEQGIPIDIVAGTSVGSLIGAAYAGGMDMYELERLVPTLSWPKLVSPSWPKNGMLNSTKLGRFLESLIGPKTIEELQVRYAAVAVDQATGDEVILRDGPLTTAVRASAAIPGLFQPIERDGRSLIDGGLVNNVPASVVRSMGADVVIAVDVRDYNYFSAGEEGGLLMSFLRGYDIMIHRAAQSELEWADVPILATKPGVNPYGFAMAKELIQAGRERAEEAMPAIRAALRSAEERVS